VDGHPAPRRRSVVEPLGSGLPGGRSASCFCDGATTSGLRYGLDSSRPRFRRLTAEEMAAKARECGNTMQLHARIHHMNNNAAAKACSSTRRWRTAKRWNTGRRTWAPPSTSSPASASPTLCNSKATSATRLCSPPSTPAPPIPSSPTSWTLVLACPRPGFVDQGRQ
jgi:hypothetical protein